MKKLKNNLNRYKQHLTDIEVEEGNKENRGSCQVQHQTGPMDLAIDDFKPHKAKKNAIQDRINAFWNKEANSQMNLQLKRNEHQRVDKKEAKKTTDNNFETQLTKVLSAAIERSKKYNLVQSKKPKHLHYSKKFIHKRKKNEDSNERRQHRRTQDHTHPITKPKQSSTLKKDKSKIPELKRSKLKTAHKGKNRSTQDSKLSQKKRRFHEGKEGEIKMKSNRDVTKKSKQSHEEDIKAKSTDKKQPEQQRKTTKAMMNEERKKSNAQNSHRSNNGAQREPQNRHNADTAKRHRK